jgi:hypothetical protein
MDLNETVLRALGNCLPCTYWPLMTGPMRRAYIANGDCCLPRYAPSPATVGEGWGGVACALAHNGMSPGCDLRRHLLLAARFARTPPSPPLQAGEGARIIANGCISLKFGALTPALPCRQGRECDVDATRPFLLFSPHKVLAVKTAFPASASPRAKRLRGTELAAFSLMHHFPASDDLMRNETGLLDCPGNPGQKL